MTAPARFSVQRSAFSVDTLLAETAAALRADGRTMKHRDFVAALDRFSLAIDLFIGSDLRASAPPREVPA